MKWKTPQLEAEFQSIHPAVALAVRALDEYSASHGLPEVVVTHVLRTPEMQEAIYWQGLAKAKGLAEMRARAEARKKFSWHLVGCAVDLRNNHYTPAQRREVMAFLSADRSAPLWEVLEHDVGRGDHIHIGRRDFSWRPRATV